MNTLTHAPTPMPLSKDVWLIAAGHGLTHWYTATFYILLPLIGKELGLSYTEIGFIMTIQYLAGAISNLPGGMVVDMIGKKGYLMAASLFWVGFPYALMSLTHELWMLLACVTLVGIGNNLWHPAAIPTIVGRYPERKGLALSIHGMGGNLGEIFAPFVVGALLAWFSWRTVVVVNVVPGIAMAAVILLSLNAFTVARQSAPDGLNAEARSRSVRSYLGEFSTLLKNRALLLIACSGAFRTMTQAGLMTFLPVYLAYELKYSPFAVGVCVMLLQVGGFFAAPVAGHLSDRMGRKRVVVCSLLMTAATIVGMALAGRSPVFVSFIALVGFFLYAVRPVLQAWAMESTPSHLAGAAVGLQFGITAVGSSLSPSVFGLIADTYDIYSAFFFLAGTIIVANFLIFFMPNGKHSKVAAAGAN